MQDMDGEADDLSEMEFRDTRDGQTIQPYRGFKIHFSVVGQIVMEHPPR
jgi:hypothetical protein